MSQSGDEEECKITRTLDVVTRLSHVVKRGLLKTRIYAATWSLIVFMAIQSYLTTTMSMATNLWLMSGVALVYVVWVGLAWWEIKRLDAEYAAKIKQISGSDE